VSHAAQRTAFVFAVPAADARRLTGPSSIISAKVETAPAPADVVRRGAGRSEHGLKSIIPAAVRSEQGIKRTPQRSCLNLLPSRATPYLAPAAGTIITATPLARASRQRRWLTLPNSADRSVPRVQTPIQGTKKPQHGPQASSADDIDVVVWRGVWGC
jgi:hypothetical protein